ncbi:hypothetical protein COT95_00150 [Candidatus Falkowbacteria bacterium CG10_big_fil_rev_8_21_14_0_10_37_6]|uniref:DUF3566 domain-containing protein n=1 Tax=Candidatus Falkowbacteria bacterium CG10_big_fil_rev_8_21_14_0_10_37_6 TaxID=1974563 RepID=A0A2H0V7X5_9BACT|nr:MAG: hypothetical protein COT95_00150 [Candidatus Falkowbacteria bacterium CG10_big_fil_rev_8_21_14_0_10_37_6]
MKTIKKIDKKSVANVYAYFLAISAFLVGIFIAFANIVDRILQGNNDFISIILLIVFNILWGVLVGLVSALVGIIIGFISGWLFASLYNLAVKIKILGGIQIELE